MENKTEVIDMRDPDFVGPYARIWSLDLQEIFKRKGFSFGDDASVGAWVIHSPMSHPIWPWYRMFLFHLRPIPKLGEPIMYLEGATHEMVLQALDPEFYPPTVEDFPTRFLTPANFAAQLKCESDAAALKLIEELALQPIITGRLNPDTDDRQNWIARFGSNMVRP